jgi:hypothetical protein
MLEISTLGWIVTIAVIVGLLALDGSPPRCSLC